MSQQELKRVEVIALRRSGQISQGEAARRLGVTVRQVRRLEARVALHGAAGLRSGRRGRPSNHRLAAATASEVGRLIRVHYRDFGPTLAAEYLQERHGIALSKETVRQIMIVAKLWRPHRGAKAAIYALRERRPRFGELIQIDGSAHAWFEDRGPRCCLLVFIDDATSRLTRGCKEFCVCESYDILDERGGVWLQKSDSRRSCWTNCWLGMMPRRYSRTMACSTS